MEYGVTKMDDRGNVRLPDNVKNAFRPGEKLYAERDGNTVIIRKASSVNREDEEVREEKSMFHRDTFDMAVDLDH